jgi:hypothetical protein
MKERKGPDVVIQSDRLEGTKTGTQYESEQIRPVEETMTRETTSYSRLDIIAAFESGAAWQREHHFVPHAMNAVEAHKEALARWPEYK